ncbi:MAG: glycosyltransferase [Eubacteriales bacterium]|nr:glycosyltransferase [Eubacteriales bacterium]
MRKKSILFITSNLGIGGVERALVALSNSLCNSFEVSILVFDPSNNKLGEELNKDITVTIVEPKYQFYCVADKGHRDRITNSQRLFKLYLRLTEMLGIKKAFERIFFRSFKKLSFNYAVSYAGYPGPWDTVARLCRAEHKYAYVHSNPYALGIDKVAPYEYYAEFDKLVCVSQDIKRKLSEIEPRLCPKCVVEYNLIDRVRIDHLARGKSPYKENGLYKIVTVARLENNSKRFDRLVDTASCMVKMGFMNFSWHIVGDGADYNSIKELIDERKLNGYLYMEGFQTNPYNYIKNADLFVLTSDYEGLPVTMMEANYLGVPMVVTDFSCAGEIVYNGINGFIVEKNSTDIALKVISLMESKELYTRIKSNIASKKILGSNIETSLYE